MRAAIRVDGASGHGHRVRCGALAEALRGAGLSVDFVDGDLAADVDLLVVDHYGLDRRWESAMRAKARRIAVIDDFPGRPHDCDLLVDPDDFAGERRVPGARVLAGPRYALLRPELAAAPRRVRERVHAVFVSFGSGDASNETAKVLEALRGRDDLRIDVAEHRPTFDGNEMAHRIAAADLAFVAGGMTLYETCCAGTPAVVAVTAENQRRAVDALVQRGAVRFIGNDTTRETYRGALESLTPGDLRSMSRIGMELVDGHGCARVAAAMLDIVRA